MRTAAITDDPNDTPPARKRLPLLEREAQILAGAIAFFSEHGLDGQMRVLATEIGVTHALLYHYFPTKQALIERVYYELFEGRWKPEWERLLDDPEIGVEEKFIRFYSDYAGTVLTREFTRIFMFSGLSDHYITDRFFTLLRTRLFPRLVRETRRHCATQSRKKNQRAGIRIVDGFAWRNLLYGRATLYLRASRAWRYLGRVRRGHHRRPRALLPAVGAGNAGRACENRWGGHRGWRNEASQATCYSSHRAGARRQGSRRGTGFSRAETCNWLDPSNPLNQRNLTWH